MNLNDPHIRAKDFLYACMRDRSLPLTKRIEAAGHLMAIEPDGPPQPTLLMQIHGMGEHPLVPPSVAICPCMRDTWDSFSIAEQWEMVRAVERLQGCNERGVDRPLSDMQVKGHG